MQARLTPTLALALAAQPLLAQDAPLFPAAQVPGGTAPEVLAVGDLDGDGALDLVSGATGGNKAFPLLGNGAGRLLSLPPVFVGPTPSGLALGNFDGDGVLDLVASLEFSGEVALLLGDGSGGFGAPSVSGVGAEPSGIAVGDLDGDGNADVAVSEQGTHGLRVLYGDGAGGLGEPLFLQAELHPENVSIADVDQDGELDLVSANAHSASLSLFAGDGNGGFAPGEHVNVGWLPNDVAFGDLDSDGDQDVVVSNHNSDGPQILFAIPGGFTHNGANLWGKTVSVDVADVDGDGDLDVATTNELTHFPCSDGEVFVHRNDGLGNFSFADQERLNVGCHPMDVRFGDWNGDGRWDVATANQGSDSVSLVLGAQGGGWVLPEAQFWSSAAIGLPYGLAVADVQGDGALDLLTGLSCSCFGESHLGVFAGESAGGFNSPAGYPFTGTHVRDLLAADFDGDGDVDAVVGAYSGSPTVLDTLSTLFNDGVGGFDAVQASVGSHDLRKLELSDLDLDGALDLVIASDNFFTNGAFSLLRGDGAGGFGAAHTVQLSGGQGGLVVAELDGDGLPDVAVGNADEQRVELYPGDGAGGVGAPSFLPLSAAPRALALADLDADGQFDLVGSLQSLDPNGPSVFRLTNLGAGAFAGLELSALGSAAELTVADVDGDSHQDVLLAPTAEHQMGVLLGDGAGGFATPRFYATTAFPEEMVGRDMDGDGRVDLVALQQHFGQTWISRNTGAYPSGVAPFGGTSFMIGWVLVALAVILKPAQSG